MLLRHGVQGLQRLVAGLFLSSRNELLTNDDDRKRTSCRKFAESQFTKTGAEPCSNAEGRAIRAMAAKR